MTKQEVNKIAWWLQEYIAKNDLFKLSAVKAAVELDKAGILEAYPSNPHLKFRDILRDYPSFTGAYQKSKYSDWFIYNKRIIAMRIAWMRNYDGVDGDIPIGAGSYVAENKDGGEAYNFRKIGGSYYGYARNQKNRKYSIEALGASKEDNKIDHVKVIFFATNPIVGGQFIVGWYNDATFYRELQWLDSYKRENRPEYICQAPVKNGTLLRTDKRVFNIAKDKSHRPGETNHWYLMKKPYPELNQEIWDFIHGAYRGKKDKGRRKGTGWQNDVEKRKKVELNAMDTVTDHFVELGFVVEDVSSQNVGWDLEATKINKKLLLEVKGLSNDLGYVELTPNEYTNSNRHNFILCIVEDALDKRMLSVFQRSEDDKWRSVDGMELMVEERVSARIGIKR
jgi:hypothetical protein